MRAVVQRVRDARVSVEESVTGAIGSGLLVYLGVGRDDAERDSEFLAEKIAGLRVFPDAAGRMNLSLAEAQAADGRGRGVLVVSQFTLYGDVRRGRRPSYDGAAAADLGERLYGHFLVALRARGIDVATGVFRAHMDVMSTNDGPVTIIIDTRAG